MTEKKEDNWLSGMHKTFEQNRKKRDQDRKEFNKELGNPDLFILDDEDPFGDERGVGYWRVEEGILTVLRPNIKYGFDPTTQEFLTEEWILKMEKLLAKKPRSLE